MGDSPPSDTLFARLRPRAATIADLADAVTAQANQHSTALIAQKATVQRLGEIEGVVSELDRKLDGLVTDIALDRARRGHELKKLGVLLSFAGALLAACVTAGVNYITRPPSAAAAPLVARSGFDRELDICDSIADAATRGKCVVDVALANHR